MTDARQSYYDEIGKQGLAPLWERLKGLVPREPKTAAMPYGWRYAEMRAALMKAGELLTAEEAERRVLIIENPGLKGQSRITGSLFAGLQLLLPGERASAHRHVAAALRFILEGSTAYTAVDGERTLMRPGDFVLTPNWTWHDHGNDGEEPVIWLDGLDMHMVNFFGASFSENYPEKEFPLARPAGDSELRYGGTMLPEGDRAAAAHSPLLNYRYDRARENLAELAAYSGPDPVHGYKLRYVNPQTGGAPMPTISAALQLLPKGFQTSEYRATDATIFAVAEGEGTSKIGEFSFDWGKNDIFVVPSWQPVTHRALTEAVLFSFSDRAAQEALGLWREKRNLRNAE